MIRLAFLTATCLGLFAAGLHAQSTALSPPADTIRAGIRLEPVTAIGCFACDGPELFGSIQALTVLPDGTVWVADSDAPIVRAFGRDGRVLHAWGRRGRGPADIILPLVLAISEREVALVDMRNQRIAQLTLDGEPLSTTRLGRFPIGAGWHPDAGLLITTARFDGAGGQVERWRAGQDSTTLVTRLPGFPAGEDGAREEGGFPAAGPGGVFAIGGGRGAYAIRVYGPDGGRKLTLTRPVQRSERTAEEMEGLRRSLAAGPGGARSGAPESGRAPRDVSRLEPHFGMNALAFDDRGWLWVRTNRGHDDRTVFDLFDPAGAFRGELIAPERLGAYDLAGDFLAAVVLDELDVQQVKIWRVRGHPAGG